MFHKKIMESVSTNTFSTKDVEVIECTRTLTDFKTFLQRILEMGPVWFSAQHFPTYIESVRILPLREVEDIEDDEIREQFKVFCHRLYETEAKVDTATVNSRDLIKLFLCSSSKLFRGIELIMHITNSAAVCRVCVEVKS